MMQTHELLGWLLETTCATSIAILFVLLLRRPLRATFGTNVAYLLWALVPLAWLAVSLPARMAEVLPPAMASTVGSIAAPGVVPAASGEFLAWFLALSWLIGCCATVLWHLKQQRNFLRSLGALRVDGEGLLRAEHGTGLPAVIGLRAAIVLPADFESRYSLGERELILAHERIHVARGDMIGNALLVVLRCLYWFNPLFLVAAERFRRDQELACDEAVVARHPRARRLYGETMVKTQLSTIPAPLACHWFGRHPLKERIAMLKRPTPSARRSIVGTACAGILIAGASLVTWAAQPAVQSPATTGGADVPVRASALPPPRYPTEAAANEVSGKVILIVDVAADGSVKHAVVEKAEPAGVFEANALAAVKRWKFKPAMEDGKPVKGRVRVPITFDSMGKPGADAPTGAGDGADYRRAAYDWIKVDTRNQSTIASMGCDAIEARPDDGIVYCGVR